MPYHFGCVRRGAPSKTGALRRISKSLDKIAEANDAEWSGVVSLPGNSLIGWFSCPNRGRPFDDAIQRAVSVDVHASGYAWIWED